MSVVRWASQAAGRNGEDALFSFLDYLELIKSRAGGFSYKLAEDISGKRKKLVGVLWMTATMHCNFELFSGYLSLDMLKCGLNTLLWPYVAVTMYDEMKKLCIGCEGILWGEKVDMYNFVARFLKECAPGLQLSSVAIVAGDGFFDQQMIVDFEFVNAMFLMDHFHLYDSGLLKYFGQSGYELLKGHLVKMIQAKSVHQFDDVLCAARELLVAQQARNGQLEQDLETFASRRVNFAQYCIDGIPGNRHHTMSEQQNSSVLCSLNDGNKKGNSFMQKPIDMIAKLLAR